MANSEFGWKPDPFRTHELRYFAEGSPTDLVRDGDVTGSDPAPVAPVAPAAFSQPMVSADGALDASAGSVFVARPTTVRQPVKGRGLSFASIGFVAALSLVIGLLLSGGSSAPSNLSTNLLSFVRHRLCRAKWP
jgi:hypothetical protein